MQPSFFKRYNAYNHFFAVIKLCTYKQPFFVKKKTHWMYINLYSEIF